MSNNTGLSATPQAIGGSLSVRAVLDLAALDISGLTLGTKVYVWGAGTPTNFTLVVSSATVDHAAVEAVQGYSSLRWVADAASNADPGTLVTLLADAANITFAGLTGDGDGDYEVDGELLLPLDAANASIVSVQPNALATNQTCRQGADSGYSDLTDLRIGGAQDGAGASLNFRFRLQSLSGRNRYYHAAARRKVNTGPGFLVYTQQGVWAAPATVITSIVIPAAYAGAGGKGLLAGSYARLRKLRFTA